jgi:putative transposase
LRRPVETAQYTCIRYTGRLDELGAAPSVGSKGDAYDNAMAEAWVVAFRSELVDGRRFPSFEHAEHEVLHWIGFSNAERLHEALGDLPPAEYEHLKYQDRQHPNAVRQITEPPTDAGSFTSCQPALRAASSMEASMLSKSLLSIVSITGPVSRPMGPPLGTYR